MVQQALHAMILLLLGINRDSWDATEASGRAAITTAARLFIAFAMLCLLGGVGLLHALTGSWWIGCTGGLFAGIMMANIVRLALITLMVRISHHPVDENAPAPEPVVRKGSQRIRDKWKNLISRIHIAGVLRIIFIGLTAGAMAFPTGALLLHGTAGGILENRRTQVIREFTERHPEYPQQRLQKYKERIAEEHFPIHVYIGLAGHPAFMLILLTMCGLAFFPYLILWNQQGKGYFIQNDSRMRAMILYHYASTVDKSVREVQRRFGPEKEVALLPHLAWENPPFNTIRRQPSPEGWMSDDEWQHWLKNS